MESLKRTGYDQDTAETVICTRDKDLRQCLGWHYGWECGKQAEYKLKWIDEFGHLEATYKEGFTKKGNPSRRFTKLSGSGLKWFYAQVLTGDEVDNIPGLPNCGRAKAYNILDPLTTEEGMLDATIALYRDAYGDTWESEFFEQVHLVWMLRERNEDGSLKWWTYPEGYKYNA
jgi:5'-3' exonuclease